jgi:hypothetical protein
MTTGPGPSKDRKTERRAQALRDNLKRRKAQARGRAQAETGSKGEPKRPVRDV